jgi:putative hydrolase of the HAD superfamily
MPAIEAIIYDFGGVLIDVDYHASVRAFENLGIIGFDTLYSQAKQTGFFDDFEIGAISDYDFRNRVREVCKAFELKDTEIDMAWNAMILGMPASRVEMICEIRTKLPVFLLSNTNIIHERCFTKMLHTDLGENPLTKMFNNVYLSHHIGMRKPDKEVFDFVLTKNGLTRESTLFIDDSIQHIEGAKQVGLQTYWLNNHTIEQAMEKIGKL